MSKKNQPTARSRHRGPERCVIRHEFTDETQIVMVDRAGGRVTITWSDGYKEDADDYGLFSGSWKLADVEFKNPKVASKRRHADSKVSSAAVEAPVISESELEEFASLVGVHINERLERD